MAVRALDPKVEEDKILIDAVDQAFQVWLVRNKMLSKSGVIYKADKVDAQGNPNEIVDSVAFSQLLTSVSEGLMTVVSELNPHIQLKIERQVK